MKKIHILLNEICEQDYRMTYNCMHSERKAKIDRLMRQQDKARSLAGEYLAKTVLSEMLNTDFEKITLLQNENGKPYIANENLFVSISHSENMAAAAVSLTPVGIDVEKIRPVSSALVKRSCFKNELEYIFGASYTQQMLEKDLAGDALERFFRIWTLKEACFKCFDFPESFLNINVSENNHLSDTIKILDYIITTVTDDTVRAKGI